MWIERNFETMLVGIYNIGEVSQKDRVEDC